MRKFFALVLLALVPALAWAQDAEPTILPKLIETGTAGLLASALIYIVMYLTKSAREEREKSEAAQAAQVAELARGFREAVDRNSQAMDRLADRLAAQIKEGCK